MIEISLLHHVTKEKQDKIGPLADYAVTPSEFESYLRYRMDCKPISDPDKLEAAEKTRVLPTFDDGYRNNLTNALPLLEKYEVPCLLFITTGFIDGTVYPYELELSEVIEKKNVLSLPGQEEPLDLQKTTDRRSLYQEVRLPLKPKSHKERERFLDQLAAQNDFDRSDMQNEPFLSWEEIRTLSEHPLVTIGAHTQSHVLLPRQPWRVAYNEIQSSKERLEQQIGQSVLHFSYPYGGNNFIVRQMARSLGFHYAFTTRASQADHVSMWNRLSLPRIDIEELLPGHE